MSAEHLGQRPGVQGSLLGINLCVAAESSGDDFPVDLQSLFETWTWKIAKWNVVDLADPTTPLAVTPVQVPTGTPDFFKVLKKNLHAELQVYAQTAELLKWSPGVATDKKTITSEQRSTWHQRLASLSTAPAPIPHSLQLAFLLALKDATDPGDTRSFLVAPEFSAAKIDFTLQSLIPPPDPNANPAYQWTFKCAPQAGVVADIEAATYTVPIERVPPSGNADLVDLSRLLVRSVSSCSTTATTAGGPKDSQDPVDPADDWVANFTDRSATGLDLLEILLQCLEKEHEPPNGNIPDAEAVAISKSFLAILADKVSSWNFPAPDGVSLTDLAKKAWGGRSPSFPLPAKPDKVPTFADWHRELAIAVSEDPSAVRAVALLDPKQSTLDKSALLRSLRALNASANRENVLPRVSLAFWRASLNSLPANWDLFERFALTEFSPTINLRKRLLLGLVGRYFRTSLSNFSTPQKPDHERARSAFVATVSQYVSDRFTTSDQFAPDLSSTQDVSPMLNLLKKRSPDIAATYAFNVLVPSPRSGPKASFVTPTRVPHALLLQSDRAAGAASSASADTPTASAGESTRHIAGTAIFLRRQGKPWRCLNAAVPVVLDGNQAVCGPTVILPSRISYVAGLKQVLESYNDAPSAAKGPLAYLADESTFAHDGKQVDPALIQYTYASAPPPGANNNMLCGRLPGLVFKGKYDAFAAVLSNTSVLPRPIADPQNPTALIAGQPKESANNTDFTAITSDYVSCFEYKRRVPIGNVRVVNKDSRDATDPAIFPSIPDDVQLLCRDSFFYDNTARGNTVLSGTENSAEKISPAVLLAENAQKTRDFTFDLLPPILDIYTWNRCVADDSTFDTSRQTAWKEYFGNAKVGTNARPLELYDPAVKSIAVDVDGTATVSVDIPKEYGKTVRVRFDCGSSGQASSDGITVVPVSPKDGEVQRIDVYLVLDPEQLKRFDKLESLSQLAAGNKLHAFTAFVERATTQLPDPEQLWRNTVVFRSAETGEIRVELSLANDPAFKTARYVGNTQFLRQVWRWNGRPVDNAFDLNTVPTVESNSDASSLLAWEATEFGWRSDDDHLQVGTHRIRRESQGGGAVAYYREDVSGDTRALFVRFGVRVASRYAGVLTGTGTISTLDSRSLVKRWRRIFFKSRRTVVPPPKVVQVIPLTEPAQSGGASHQPGLLAILAEPWFQLGGLAERMQATTALTTQRSGVKPIHEFGPDPTTTVTGCAVEAGKDLWNPSPGALIGPVGHTFDTELQDPLFVSSSFIVRPPDLTDCGNAGNFSWYFIKLQFKRILEGKYRESSPNDVGTPLALESEFTDSHWTQYLPGFSNWQDNSLGEVDAADLYADAGDSASSFVIRKSGGQVFEPKPSVAGSSAILSIITEKIFDAYGFEAESYVGAARLSATNNKHWEILPFDATAGSTRALPKEFLVRLVEVQLPVGNEHWLESVSNELELWAGLFGDPNSRNDRLQSKKDVLGRIVRVSKYFRNASSSTVSQALIDSTEDTNDFASIAH